MDAKAIVEQLGRPLLIVTTWAAVDEQERADIVVDVGGGVLIKNRVGPTTPTIPRGMRRG